MFVVCEKCDVVFKLFNIGFVDGDFDGVGVDAVGSGVWGFFCETVCAVNFDFVSVFNVRLYFFCSECGVDIVDENICFVVCCFVRFSCVADGGVL